MTSMTPKYVTNLMTRDQGTIHKLKPRLFNKLFSAPMSLSVCWSLLSGFILSLSNIPLQDITLLYSGVYFLSITLHLHTLSIHSSALLDIGAESDLLNDLGFNLCVAPRSPVVRLVAYFGVREVAKTEVLRSRSGQGEIRTR